jgi:very-short-patch-repair endonuclease
LSYSSLSNYQIADLEFERPFASFSIVKWSNTMSRRETPRRAGRSEDSIAFARAQRRTSNEFARTLWQWLRARRCRGQNFRREYPIPPYTADFCCVDLKLIIEVDGKHHMGERGRDRDQRRDYFLRNMGYRTLRIPGYDVLNQPREVLGKIEAIVNELLATD